MEAGDDRLESEANVRPRPRLTGAGQPRGCPAARWTAIDRGLSRDPLAQARLNRSAKGAGTGHSPRYPKSGTTQSDRLLVIRIPGPEVMGPLFGAPPAPSEKPQDEEKK